MASVCTEFIDTVNSYNHRVRYLLVILRSHNIKTDVYFILKRFKAVNKTYYPIIKNEITSTFVLRLFLVFNVQPPMRRVTNNGLQ